jgi:hypothetical protein
MGATPTPVDLYFDPACPFAWITSRWLLEVRRHRELALRWHPVSAYLLNAGRDLDASYQNLLNHSPAPARVLTAAGAAALPELYTALGNAMFSRDNHEVVHDPMAHTGRWAAAMRAAIGTALAEVGLAASLAEAADSTAQDDALRANQNTLIGMVGGDVGTPVIGIGGTGIFGPVLTSIPRGAHAVRLFEAVLLLAEEPNFFELKRTLTGEFSFA